MQHEWNSSAKRKLGERFEDVRGRHEDLLKQEDAEKGRLNAIALKEWADTSVPGWGLEEKIQMLDQVVSGVWNLGESGGKYSRVVWKFERWLARVQDILEERERGEGLVDREVAFVEEMEEVWKEDCHVLARKLEGWRDQLKDLGPADGASGVAAVVRGCRTLVHGMLAELNVMRQIQTEAVTRENEWIRDMNDDVTDDEDQVPADGAWRL